MPFVSHDYSKGSFQNLPWVVECKVAAPWLSENTALLLEEADCRGY